MNGPAQVLSWSCAPCPTHSMSSWPTKCPSPCPCPSSQWLLCPFPCKYIKASLMHLKGCLDPCPCHNPHHSSVHSIWPLAYRGSGHLCCSQLPAFLGRQRPPTNQGKRNTEPGAWVKTGVGPGGKDCVHAGMSSHVAQPRIGLIPSTQRRRRGCREVTACDPLPTCRLALLPRAQAAAAIGSKWAS